MVSPIFGVSDTEPSARAGQKGDQIRQIASLGLLRVRSRRTQELPWIRADRLAQAIAFRESFPAPGSTRWSSPRQLIPSFAKTFARWYSTVRGLTKMRAPIARFDKPSRAMAAIRTS